MRNASRSQDVEAIVWLILAANLLDDDTALQAGVGHQLAQRFVERAPEYLSADLLVTFKLHVLQRAGATQQRGTAARQHALFDRSSGRVQGILHARLDVLRLAAALDDG